MKYKSGTSVIDIRKEISLTETGGVKDDQELLKLCRAIKKAERSATPA